jgi:hypothetical protein
MDEPGKPLRKHSRGDPCGRPGVGVVVAMDEPAPTMDGPGKPLRKHSRGDGLSSPWGGVVALGWGRGRPAQPNSAA